MSPTFSIIPIYLALYLICCGVHESEYQIPLPSSIELVRAVVIKYSYQLVSFPDIMDRTPGWATIRVRSYYQQDLESIIGRARSYQSAHHTGQADEDDELLIPTVPDTRDQGC